MDLLTFDKHESDALNDYRHAQQLAEEARKSLIWAMVYMVGAVLLSVLVVWWSC